MRKLIAAFLILCTGQVVGAGPPNEIHWGGPGYDPELKRHPNYPDLSSKFTARHSMYKKGMVEILVDSRETVTRVMRMKLLTVNDQKAIESRYCFKAMRHLSAPWACYFDESEVRKLTGRGRIEVFVDLPKPVLQGLVNFEELNSLRK